METAPAKQRSPWFYVLLGCGGLAGLMCLGSLVVVLGFGKAVNDMAQGVTDPAERQANAIKQLGGIPEGYSVVASLNVLLMKMTLLTDAPTTDDGGLALTNRSHIFTYFDVIENDNSKGAKAWLQNKPDADPSSLARAGVRIDTANIVKRGTLTVDGRKLNWVASRGKLENGPQSATDGLHTAVLFDCAGNTNLRVGVWSQQDPAPEAATEALDLAGTVADEAELVRFLKPIDPCGR